MCSLLKVPEVVLIGPVVVVIAVEIVVIFIPVWFFLVIIVVVFVVAFQEVALMVILEAGSTVVVSDERKIKKCNFRFFLKTNSNIKSSKTTKNITTNFACFFAFDEHVT